MSEDAPRPPLTAITLSDSFDGGISSFLGAEIDAAGALVISSEEGAALCEAMRTDLDSDAWLSVPSPWKDELLLRLLAERFGTIGALREYLDAHGIPCAGHATGADSR